MDDIFDKLKDNLENRPEPAFDAASWEKMEAKLDQKPGSTSRPLPPWWLALLLFIPLLLSNIYLFNQLKETNHRLEQIHLTKDTIIQTKTIYLTDTIFQTKTVYVNTNTSKTNYTHSQKTTRQTAPDFISPRGQKYMNPDYFKTAFVPFGKKTKENINTPGILFGETPSNKKETTPHIHSPAQPVPYPEIKSVEGRTIPYIPEVTTPSVLNKKKYRVNPLYFFYPQNISLGLTGGTLFPYGKALSGSSGYSYGLKLGIHLPSSIRLQMEASWMKFNLDTDEINPGIGFPDINIDLEPEEEVEDLHAQASPSALQLNMGLQYVFNPSGKWRPFAGLSYSFTSVRSYQATYNFEIEEEEEEEEMTLLSTIPEFRSHGLLFNAGLEYQLSNRFSIQLEAYNHWKVGQNELQLPNFSGIKTAVLYNF